MTALRYHIDSAARGGCGVERGMGLHEVIEVLLRADVATHTEDRGRNKLQVETHEIPAPAPQVPRASQEIVHLKRVVRLDAKLGQVELDVSFLRVVRIQVYHDKD